MKVACFKGFHNVHKCIKCCGLGVMVIRPEQTMAEILKAALLVWKTDLPVALKTRGNTVTRGGLGSYLLGGAIL